MPPDDNTPVPQALAPVLIVGAGPVGLTLAIDLAWRGIKVTVAETRPRAQPPEPKRNHVPARTAAIGMPGRDRVRRRPVDGGQGDWRDVEWRCRDPARAIEHHPRAGPDRSPAPCARLGDRRDQSAPRRHRLCDRRTPNMAGA